MLIYLVPIFIILPLILMAIMIFLPTFIGKKIPPAFSKEKTQVFNIKRNELYNLLIDYENYPAWSRNLVCAFFDRMQEMLNKHGGLGAIFDRTVMIKSSYESFRKRNLCGYITHCADSGWGVLDANVETSTLVIDKSILNIEGVFFNLLDFSVNEKEKHLESFISDIAANAENENIYKINSIDFLNLPNTIIGKHSINYSH